MINNKKKISQSFCSFNCLDECKKKQNQFPNNRHQKLSLKKIVEENQRKKQMNMKKSISSQKFEKYLLSTNRSNKDRNEIMLFRKKQKIQKQLQQVYGQISKLKMKYNDEVRRLKHVILEIQSIRHQ